MGAINSLPTLDEVQALMRERNYQGFDAAVLSGLVN
jgi:hypothetical protein